MFLDVNDIRMNLDETMNGSKKKTKKSTVFKDGNDK